mmetsp:Transcript_21645/g.40134  ORF Transcript_21645/g.40134 Transcript_21645/m.40134 type:complete len:207 (+) Transcript_21645:860-1480(+)
MMLLWIDSLQPLENLWCVCCHIATSNGCQIFVICITSSSELHRENQGAWQFPRRSNEPVPERRNSNIHSNNCGTESQQVESWAHRCTSTQRYKASVCQLFAPGLVMIQVTYSVNHRWFHQTLCCSLDQLIFEIKTCKWLSSGQRERPRYFDTSKADFVWQICCTMHNRCLKWARGLRRRHCLLDGHCLPVVPEKSKLFVEEVEALL